MSSMLTRSGRIVDLLHVTPEDINLDDIAWALANINRFTGHARRPYSVAEHSINVARLLPEPIKIYGLLHDAHEAYIGDIGTPMKQALESTSPAGRGYFSATLEIIEAPIIAAIHKKLGVPWPVSQHVAAAVKYADVTMVEHELGELFDGAVGLPRPELPMPRWPITHDAPYDVGDHWRELVNVFRDDLRAAA